MYQSQAAHKIRITWTHQLTINSSYIYIRKYNIKARRFFSFYNLKYTNLLNGEGNGFRQLAAYYLYNNKMKVASRLWFHIFSIYSYILKLKFPGQIHKGDTVMFQSLHIFEIQSLQHWRSHDFILYMINMWHNLRYDNH